MKKAKIYFHINGVLSIISMIISIVMFAVYVDTASSGDAITAHNILMLWIPIYILSVIIGIFLILISNKFYIATAKPMGIMAFLCFFGFTIILYIYCFSIWKYGFKKDSYYETKSDDKDGTYYNANNPVYPEDTKVPGRDIRSVY